MLKHLLVVAFCLAMISSARANRLLEAFSGMSLQLDTTIESPASLSNTRNLPIPAPGEVIEIQLFIPSAAGKKTFGYDVTFAIAGKDIGQYFQIPSGTDWEGTALSQTASSHTATALLLSQPEFPSSGYLGTIRFTTISSPSEGDVLLVSSGFVGDINTDRDELNVSSASVTFSNQIEPIAGDIDLDGDVDFVDFLTFAGNFGKSGPAPSPIQAGETIVITNWDTIVNHQVTTVRETITVTKTDTLKIGSAKSDTIYITQSQSQQRTRAERLLGFWKFEYQIISTFDQEYVFGEIAEPDSAGAELTVFGSSAFRDIVAAGYYAPGQNYSLYHDSGFIIRFFVFTLDSNDKVTGDLYYFFSGETVADASLYPLVSPSGRIPFFSSKPSVEPAPPTKPAPGDGIPAKYLQRFYHLKSLAESQ